MSTRNRKNSHSRRFRRVTDATVRNFLLVSIADVTNGMGLYQMHSHRRLRPSDRLRLALTSMPFEWCISIGVAARSQTGDEYIKSAVVTHDSIFERALDSLYEHHNKLIAEMNPTHIITGGWVASPGGKEISKEDEFRLYKELGTFDNLTAPWENRNDHS